MFDPSSQLEERVQQKKQSGLQSYKHRSQYSQSQVAKKKDAASSAPSVKVAYFLEQPKLRRKSMGRLAHVLRVARDNALPRGQVEHQGPTCPRSTAKQTLAKGCVEVH